MPSDIPGAREALLSIAEDIGGRRGAKIADIVFEKLFRDRPMKKAAPTAAPVSPPLRREVRAFYKRHRSWSNREIGRHFRIDGGRVSEILRGLR